MNTESGADGDGEGDGLGIISSICSSLSSIILSIFIVFGIYMYYQNIYLKNENASPFIMNLSKIFQLDAILNSITGTTRTATDATDTTDTTDTTGLTTTITSMSTFIQPLQSTVTPKPLVLKAGGAAALKPGTNDLLMSQEVDKCSSDINGGTCNNSLIKGDCSFSVTSDGNLVLKKGDKILWQSFTSKDRPNTTYIISLTNEGNLMLFTNDYNVIWSNNNSETVKKAPYKLILRDDNNLVIENSEKTVVWQTDTAGGKESSAMIARANTGLIGPGDTSDYLEYTDVVKNLPSSFRLETSLPPTDQYDVATCVVSQILGMFTYYYWKLFNKEYWFSRLFTWHYNQLDTNSDPSENLGTYNSDVYNTIKKRGLLLEKYYAYDGTIESGASGIKNTCSTPKYREKPQNELLNIAKKNIPQFTVYNISGASILDKIKSAIFNGMPILCGIATYASYNSTSTNTTGVITYPDKATEKANPGGHMVSLWGWDDSKEIFHLLNTRGSNYMNKGWCTIPYRYILDSQLAGPSFECFKLKAPVADIVDDDSYTNNDDWVFKKDLGCVFVNTVQKGVECFEPPPKGYDWTTAGGVLIGKSCPSGTNDSGTTCWYDRGGGRIPDKRACADGERDTPTECWLDTYGVGGGRPADYGDCPPRSSPGAAGDCYADQTDREDSRNDSEPWGKSWDKNDGCSWNRHIEAGVCFRACPDGFFGRAYDKCWANGADSFGVMKRSADRLKCNDDEDKDGLRCYPKCKAGFHKVGCCLCQPDNGGPRVTKWLHDRQYCADDEELKDGSCYKKCREGFNAGVTICEFSKDIKSGKFKKLVSHCK